MKAGMEECRPFREQQRVNVDRRTGNLYGKQQYESRLTRYKRDMIWTRF